MSATIMINNDTLQPTTLGNAIEIMADPLGLDPCEDKDEIIKFINKARNYLFNRYKRLKIFDSAFFCLQPQKFPLDCNDPCDKCRQYYYGITLPREAGGVVSAKMNGEPMPLRSRWRENHTGIVTSDYVETQLIEISGRYPTERHMLKPSQLKIFTYHEKDNGKQVSIEVIDCDGNPQVLQFALEYNSFSCVDLMVSQIRSVSLPKLFGHIALTQDDGYELSIYNSNDDNVPNYKRLRVLKGCENSRILVQTTRTFRNINFEDEIVEVGDSLVLEELARFFRYRHSKDKEEREIAYEAEARAYDYIDNLLARDRGRHTQDNPKYGGIDGMYGNFPQHLYYR